MVKRGQFHILQFNTLRRVRMTYTHSLKKTNSHRPTQFQYTNLHYLFIHCLIDGYAGEVVLLFYITNKTAVNIFAHGSCCLYTSFSRSARAKSLGVHVFRLIIHYPLFSKCFYQFTLHRQCRRLLTVPQPCQHLLFLD